MRSQRPIAIQLHRAPRRALALQKRPGEYDARGLKALDLVVETCRRRGLKLLLSLTDNWKYYNGCALAGCASQCRISVCPLQRVHARQLCLSVSYQ